MTKLFVVSGICLLAIHEAEHRREQNLDKCTRFYFWKNNNLFTEDASSAKFRRHRRDAHSIARNYIFESETLSR